TLCRPASPKPIVDSYSPDPRPCRPFRYGEGLPKSHNEVAAGHSEAPAAVVRGIPLTSVYPFNRGCLVWASPHIVQEILEGVTPAGADSDATVSVCVIEMVARIGAALDDGSPMPPLPA